MFRTPTEMVARREAMAAMRKRSLISIRNTGDGRQPIVYFIRERYANKKRQSVSLFFSSPKSA
jgi:hypothetical protein